MPTSLELIYFSPTRTTAKILAAIAEGFGAEEVVVSDATFGTVAPTAKKAAADFTVLGLPVYGGRIPKLAEARLAGLSGGGAQAAAVVVYGNRDFDDALLETRDLLEARGYSVVSGGAFVGEHSFSTAEKPVAPGRPDDADLAAAREYGRKLRAMAGMPRQTALAVPGSFPYKERKPSSGITPETDAAKCTACLSCVKACPAHAIDAANPLASDGSRCIRCGACIRACPATARAFTAEAMVKSCDWLFANCRERREPDTFF